MSQFVPAHISPIQLEAWWIKQARLSPYFFIWYLTEMKPARHHEIWLKSMFDPSTARLNIIAPRDSAKTTEAVYAMAWLMSKDPYTSNAIIAVKDDTAIKRLTMLRFIFENNPRFRNVFPWIHIDKKRRNTEHEFCIWSELSDAGRRIEYNHWRANLARRSPHLMRDPSVYAIGQGSANVGGRLNGILLLDDLVDINHLSSDAQNKVISYINTILTPSLMETARVWNIGTRWMIGDIYEQLSENPAWHTIAIPAILYDETGMAYSYWPEFWSLHKLEARRIEMNDDMSFRIMYLCDPSAVTASLFKPEYLSRNLPIALPFLQQVFITTDMAASLKTRADWTVLYLWGVDAAQNIYLLDGVRLKEEGTDVVQRIIQLADLALILYERLDGILIENVAFQILFEQMIRTLRPDLPVIGVIPKGDKMHRAKQVSYWAMKGKLYINQALSFLDQLKVEWYNFPMHKHDDTLDAASILFQHLTFGAVAAQLLHVNMQKMSQVIDAKVKAKALNLSRLRRN